MLSSLGLDKGQCTKENLEIAKSLVPEVLKKYVERESFFFFSEPSLSSFLKLLVVSLMTLAPGCYRNGDGRNGGRHGRLDP